MISWRCATASLAGDAPSWNRQMNSHRRAFTLVELLVVIAIIAILAAILFPVFARARDRASQAQCLSNLRQLGLGIQNYQDDWDGRFPFAIDYWDRNLQNLWVPYDRWIPNASANVALLSKRLAPDGSPFGGQIDRVLRPYTISQDVWRCPGDTGVAGLGAATSQGYTKEMEHIPVWRISRGTGTWGGTSYVYRTELGLAMKPVYRLRLPSKTNVLFDAAPYWHARLHRAPRAEDQDFNDYQLGSYNILYADGHVYNGSVKDYSDAWYDPYRTPGGMVNSPFQ
jgi:general secretion pathway protein G